MTTRKMQTSMPTLKEVIPDPNAFPTGFRWPPIAVIRQAVVEAERGEADVTVIGYGVVSIRHRGDRLHLSYLPTTGEPVTVEWSK